MGVGKNIQFCRPTIEIMGFIKNLYLMAKKFITFIGATKYEETQYYFNNIENNISSPFCYVQAAIFEKVLTDWGNNDSVFVFTTKDAGYCNYQNRLIKALPQKEVLPNEGLESELKKLKSRGKIGSYENVEIPDGNDEQEIWEIFQRIFDKINLNDELYFDITNGFRSLPMLGMVLLDYAKALKGITPKAIFYGNFEAGRAKKTEADKYVKAPVIDVTSFANLQAWTTAAQAFLKGGNAHFLANLIMPINADLAKNLTAFTDAILTCRGKMLTQDLDIDSFKNLVSLSYSTTYEKQLTNILKAIEAKLTTFHSQNTLNGFKAVDWAIENGLIQQGYTFLLETIISYVIEIANGLDKVNMPLYRDCAAAALQGFPNIRNNGTFETPNIVAGMRTFVNSKRNLSITYKNLTGYSGLRNDINHCGYKRPYASPEELKENLKNIFSQIKQILAL